MHGATQIFVTVDYVKQINKKKSCKYSEYGSFEHLLFLFDFFLGGGGGLVFFVFFFVLPFFLRYLFR